MKVVELSDDPRSLSPLVVLPSVNYQIINADYLLLRDTSQDVMDNSSLRSQRQPFILTGLNGQPAINVSYGPMSLEQSIPLHMIHTGPRIRPFILTHQVRPSTPALYVLFYATSNRDDMSEMLMQNIPGQNEGGYLCVTAYAFWESREVRDSCSISADGGFCLVHLKPEPAWFNTGGSRSSWEQRGDQRGNVVELYYQIRPSPSGQCVLQESKIRRGTQHGELGRQIYGTSMKRIGTVNLLVSQCCQPRSFYFSHCDLFPLWPRFPRRLTPAHVCEILTWQDSTVSKSHQWRGGTDELSGWWIKPRDTGEKKKKRRKEAFGSVFKLNGGHVVVLAQAKGDREIKFSIAAYSLYTLDKYNIVKCPIALSDTELLNTAVLTGKRVSVPVKVLGVEADGSITDITNSSHCRSSDQDVLKVSERCDSVYVNGKETCGRVRMMVNFTYSYLSTQLEVSVWMPRLPLHMEISDPELSQIKAWRVPTPDKRCCCLSWDTEEEDERKGRGCMLQYQHSLIRVLTVFTAESPDPSSPSPAYFLGSDWQVDVTWLVRYFLRVGDTSVARLQAGSVLTGKAVGVTTVQVISPLSDSVLAERMIRVLDDKVSITELGVQLVSGLSLNLQLSPGRSRAIVAKTTTQEIIHYPKQEAVVGCWLKFSDGSQTPLDLFDPSGYSLTISSLNPRVASVRKIPGSVFVVVAEAEGQGLLLRAELAICEACQKSKRKSKLAVGGGMVKVKFPPDEQLAGTGWRQIDPYIPSEHTSTHQPKREPPLVESDLIQMFSVFTDIEVCIYALVGLSCLAVIAILLHCATNSARSRSKKSPVQCQGQSEHKHHWVRLGTVAEQNRAVPIATTSKQEMQAAVKIPRAIQMQNSRGPETIQPREIPAIAGEERTATLGRRTNTLPPRRDPMAPLPLMAVRSATLLARPVRSEPLHSPTSKRNQVQFTTFATLDIKHLAALKNGQNFSWASQPVGGCQAASIGQGGLNGKVERVNHVHFCSPVEVFGQTPESKDSQGFLPEGPWPVATPTPVSKV
uniref:Si:dkey-1d7.3 n=1 Tax=Sinocyclocheilus rhinocerous TaxID=307959 RepID=A0A673JLE3_9TELE